MLLTTAVAILPVLILAGFILRKDRANPEPPGQLLKAFGFGALSVIPALLLISLGEPFVPADPRGVGTVILASFCGAAIPEEVAKLLLLWLLLRRNPYFDEKVDGIVYAVCVSLGFAAVENLLYLAGHAGQLMEVGVARALFAIPGHFCNGVLMGYYYSRARFGVPPRRVHRLLIIAAPVLAHGGYDSFLSLAGVTAWLRPGMLLFFPLFCYGLWKYATHRIAWHLRADGVLPRR